MATNWEIERFKELLKADDSISDENKSFYEALIEKPGSAVRYSKEIRTVLKMLEEHEISRISRQSRNALLEGREDDSAAIANGIKARELIAKSETEKSFYSAKINPVKAKIIGQDAVLSEVKRKLFVSSVLMNSGNSSKPRAFVFAGGSTNGKTATAMKIGEALCGTALKMQMSNLTSEHEVSLITGVAPGYQGATEKTVIERYMEKVDGKYCIVFDEIEKAPPRVFRFLLELLDSGFLTLLNGKVLDLRNSVVIFTTNVGTKEIREPIGFAIEETKCRAGANGNAAETDGEFVKKSVESMFPPETMNRIGRDNIYVFRDLDRNDKKKIVANMVDEALDELESTIVGLAKGTYSASLKEKLKAGALTVAETQLERRSLRELRESVVDSIVLSAASM